MAEILLVMLQFIVLSRLNFGNLSLKKRKHQGNAMSQNDALQQKQTLIREAQAQN